MNSLLTLALGFLKNGDLLSAIAKKLNIEEAQVQKILVIAVPLLIQALSKNVEKKSGADALFEAISEDHDGSILDDPAGFLNNSTLKEGAGILKHVLGSQSKPLAGQLAELSGVDPKIATEVLGMAAPVVMGALGKMQSEGEVDKGSLSGILDAATSMADKQAPGLLGAVKGLLDSDGDGKIDDQIVKMGSSLLSNLFK